MLVRDTVWLSGPKKGQVEREIIDAEAQPNTKGLAHLIAKGISYENHENQD